ncbi:MAG: hypothetical protein KBT11_02120 [Treponema sp.]|nr:hypothetical protein [Candidatus Treponema equifaecale]
MKFNKIALAFVLLFIPLYGGFCRTGIGGAYTYNLSTTPTDCVSATFRQDTQPWSVLTNAHLDCNKFSVFVDNWFINERIAEHLDYFVLWGISGEFLKNDEKMEISTGARAGIGLDFFFFRRHLEIFTQFVWNPYYGIKLNEDNEISPLFRPASFPCTAGLRLWF